MKCLEIGILCLVILSTVSAAPLAPAAEEDEIDGRLPTTTIPSHYDIELKTDIHTGQRRFEGLVRILVDVAADVPSGTNVLTLHSRGLTITAVTPRVIDSENVNIFESNSTSTNDFLHLHVTRSLIANEKLTIEITYEGRLQTSMAGFYMSSYRVGGATRYLGTTQFESTSARLAFPCYDEPALKAKFTLSITHATSYNAISNMPETVIPIDENYSVTSFEETPEMSTYLLAFIVSDFGYTTNKDTPEGALTLHRVYARQEAVEKTHYSLARSYEFLDALETYVGYEYELEKMYSAAIPDFAAGAMENWGMITYKEQYLIGDENSHPREILDIHRVTAHELGHQFFGNVVTCKWWNYIWLNEGFATVFEYLLPEIVNKDLRFRDYFNVRTLQNALLVDADEVHPMTYDGNTNSRIIYDKSGSVIRMFQHAVGEEAWVAGLLRYLQDNNHKPVTSDDLFAAIESAILEKRVSGAEFDFTQAFRTWETQTGYPLIRVSTDVERALFVITQERYWAAAESRRDDTTRSWYIPLNYATADISTFDDTTITDFFEDGVVTKEIPLPTGFDNNKWFIFNKQQMGLYRVNYEQSNWNALINVLNSPNFDDIHVLNRAQLVDDSLNLAADGYLDFATAFGVLSYLERETDYIPWRAAVTSLDKIDYLLKGDPMTQTYFRRFVNRLVRNMYIEHGVEEKAGDDLMTKFARETAIDWACRTGDQECLTQTSNLLKKALAEDTTVPASLEITYICNGLLGTNQQEHYVVLWKRMQESNDQSERLRLIDGLMCSNDKKVLVDFLVTSLTEGDESNYKSHERTRILNGIFSKSSIGITATIEFLKTYPNEAASTYGWGSINSLITSMSKRIITDEDAAALNDLMDHIDSSNDLKTSANLNIKFNRDWRDSIKYSNIESFVRNRMKIFVDLEGSLRLQKHTLPSEYRLKLDVRHLHDGVLPFTGDVEIDAEIVQPTDFIQLHSRNQAINALHVFRNGGTQIPIYQYVLATSADTLTIYFFEVIPAETVVTIHISYSSNLLTGSSGFYQTSYVDAARGRRYVGATQFESTSARYAFPNFDEPGFKAVFKLEITHDESYHAIANMPETPVNNRDGTITTTFEPTPPMSSYLLAFVVSDLVSVTNAEGLPEETTLHRIWIRPDSQDKANYALVQSILALGALEAYARFDFKLPKVDSAGVPNKGGAMENWGMVTYRENAMIYEVEYEDISHTQKLSGVDVISHELAHQFFGDSVTCEWWDYIWLNEGFATLFEWHLMGINHAGWNVRNFFNTRTLQSAFRSDSRVNTRAMTPADSLLTPAAISAAFDYVVYDKAGSVLRMFQNVLGEEIFRASLSRYLNENDHKAVTSDALVAAFAAEMAEVGLTTFDFDTAFRSWERTPGYPMIHVTLSGGQFQVNQERFFTIKNTTSTDTSNWHIPLNFATPTSDFKDTRVTNWFNNGLSQMSITAPTDASQWFIFNKQQMGYYRVNYDDSNWNALANTLNSENFDDIHVLNRAQIFDDAVNFASGGYIDYDIVRSLLTYFSQETDYVAWYTADRFISTLYTTFGPFNENLNLFVRHLSEKFYDGYDLNEFGTVDFEELYERFGRELSTKLACNSGNSKCLDDTLIQNFVFLAGRKVPNGLQAVTFCNGFKKESGSAVWVEFWKLMQSTSDATFKSQAISALGCTSDKEVLKTYLESSIGDSNNVNYSTAERRNVLSAVLTSVNGLEVVINFLTDFQLDIMRTYGYTLEALLTVVARTVKDQEHYNAFIAYLANVIEELGSVANNNIVAILNSNMNAQNAEPFNGHMQFIIEFLRERGITEAPTTMAPETTTSTTSSTAVQTTTTVPITTAPDTSTSTTSIPAGQTTTPAAETTTPLTSVPTTDPSTSVPTTVPSTNAPSTPESVTETTTAGAASLSIQIAVMITAILCVFQVKP